MAYPLPMAKEILRCLNQFGVDSPGFVPLPMTLENVGYYAEAILEIWGEDEGVDFDSCMESAIEVIELANSK